MKKNKLESEDEQVERLIADLRGPYTQPNVCEQAADLLESQALTIKRLEHEISARKV